MSISQIRGAILEEVILSLLERLGYRTVLCGEEGTERNGAGLVVCGRGEWHQIDALAAFDHSPAFMYPLRLLLEAKCYAKTSKPIGIDVMRNTVGVLTDISQNYFTIQAANNPVQVQRFNYHAAVFSTNGFSANAIRYAIAHQIFPIQYKDVPLMEPISDLLLSLEENQFAPRGRNEEDYIARVRQEVREIFRDEAPRLRVPLLPESYRIVREIAEQLRNIGGSYFGMLQGRWPLHLLSEEPLPPQAFQRDVASCRVAVNRNGLCRFQPSEFGPESQEWFTLQFSLPDAIIDVLNQNDWNAINVADVKRQHFSRVSLSGIVGGVRRQVRLELNQNMLNAYLERVRNPE